MTRICKHYCPYYNDGELDVYLSLISRTTDRKYRVQCATKLSLRKTTAKNVEYFFFFGTYFNNLKYLKYINLLYARTADAI